ncbi:unnamed protein product [Toxocara canis]|uniref:CWF19-like protein 1 n=1 Tax=Toxocara canis TaxID=6265 RepID=A0A183V349_TOXCA|nr:unnamed protein product [Toxocara canis]
MAAKPTKVLVSGDVNGHFEQLIKRVVSVNKKNGPFDMLICVGEFFGDDVQKNEEVIGGQLQFPITTYILGPCCQSTSTCYPDESAEFSSNLTYMGKKGILSTTTGLQIAYLSGIEGSQSASFQFSKTTVDELLLPVTVGSGFLGVDLLVTSMWPSQVWKHSLNQPSREVNGSRLISKLAAGLKPRYHFAGMGIHYERTPYRNHRVLLEAAQHVTRFIGLASVNNTEKEKWLYAFSIVPGRKMSRAELTAQPPNASEFPYMEILANLILESVLFGMPYFLEYKPFLLSYIRAPSRIAKKKVAQEERTTIQGKNASTSGQQYFFDMSEEVEDHVDRGGKRRRKNDDEGSLSRQPCWFCLSNTDVEKYLILSVANHCYAAMPKGPLTDDHVMILSIGHIQSLVAAPQEVRDDVQRFKDAFTLMFDKHGKVVVMFERNFKTQHLQLQIVPLPKSCSKALRSSFINAAQLKNVELVFLKPHQQIWDLVNEGCPYFYVELPEGTRMFALNMRNFPLHFGREVLAGRALLNCEEKVDWRVCEIPRDEQAVLVKKLQESFKPFDFTDADSDSE